MAKTQAQKDAAERRWVRNVRKIEAARRDALTHGERNAEQADRIARVRGLGPAYAYMGDGEALAYDVLCSVIQSDESYVGIGGFDLATMGLMTEAVDALKADVDRRWARLGDALPPIAPAE